MPVETIQRLKENHNLLRQGILTRQDLSPDEQRELIYAEQKRLFAATDDFLDANPNGPYWLRERDVAELVSEAMHHRDGKQYDLHAFTVMPNHVHMMLTLLPDAPVLFKVMQGLKRFTGLYCNRCLEREGQFWETESYDHIVRDEREFWNILNYILRNPLKAGLVQGWEQWPFTFVKPELL